MAVHISNFEVKCLARCVNQFISTLPKMDVLNLNRDRVMSKSDIQNYGKKDLVDLATFWRRLIDELEMKNPDDVLPEMRDALADTEACLKELASASI